MEDSAPASRRRRAVRITDRDRELLAFVADHRLVLVDHVQTLLGLSAGAAYARLRALSDAGFLKRRAVFHRQPAAHQITRQGLAVIGSALPPPMLDVRGYGHDVGVAWLWLAARRGTFGAVREVISERQLRSRDANVGERPAGLADSVGDPGEGSEFDEGPRARGRRLAVRLGGFGPGGQERLHYPDLLLVTEQGKRIALELELSPKGRTRREKILSGYAADARIDAVVYLVEDRTLGRSIAASARRLGISKLVHVQMVRLTARAAGGGATRVAERSPGRGADPGLNRDGRRTEVRGPGLEHGRDGGHGR